MTAKHVSHWLVLANVAVGTFMSTLDGSIVNVALPAMAKSFEVNIDVLQWVVTAYLLTISSLLPVFGRLADILGRSRVYAAGFLVFVAGSVFCGFSTAIWALVVSRVLQAIGAAMLMANGMAIITSVFPPEERGQALGISGTVVAAGSLTGPSIGGFLVAAFGWPSIFLVNLPIGLAGFLLSRSVLPRDYASQEREPFDYLGAVFFTLGMFLTLFGLSSGERFGWSSPVIWLSLICGGVGLSVFFYHEKKAAYPMLDLKLFQNKIFLFGNLAGLISFVSMFATTLLMPFYMDKILHFEPREIGLMMTPFPLAMAVIAPLSGRLSDRIGPVILTTLGMGINSLGLVLLSFLTPNASYFTIFWRMFLLGVGMGLFQSPNNSSVMGAVPRTKLGVAGGVNSLVRNVGMVTGIAFSVSLFVALLGFYQRNGLPYQAAFMSSQATVFRAAAVFALAGLFFSTVRGKYYREQEFPDARNE